MRSVTVALLCMLGWVHSGVSTKPGGNVVVLNKENFRGALKNSQRNLLLFCTVDDAGCKDFASEWQKLTNQWVNDDEEYRLSMQFGTVDGREETELIGLYKVRKYPTLLLVQNLGGKRFEYKGGLYAPEILRWLNVMKGDIAAEIATADELASLKASDQTTVVGFFKNMSSPAANTYKEFVKDCLDEIRKYEKYSTAMLNFPFGITSNDDVFKAADAHDGQVVVFKHFHNYQERSVLDKIKNVNQTRSFVYNNSMPVVIEFPYKMFSRIWTTREVNYSLLLSIDKNMRDYDNIAANYLKCAEKFRGEVRFLLLNNADDSSDAFRAFFDLKKSNKTLMRMFHYGGDFPTFKPENETDFNPATLSAFVQNVLDGKVKPYVESQDLPDDWNKKPVKILVADNFREVVYDKSKSVLVKFHCQDFPDSSRKELIYEKLGEIYKGSPDILITKFDKYANHLEEVRFEACSSFKLYKKGSNEVVEFRGPATLENLRAFVDSDGGVFDFWQSMITFQLPKFTLTTEPTIPQSNEMN